MLTYKTIEEVPEDKRSEYEEFEGSYVHKGHLQVRKDMAQYKTKAQELESKLNEIAQAEAQRKAELEKQEREKLAEKNDYKSLLERYQAEAEQEKNQLLEQLNSLKTESINSKRAAVVGKLAGLATQTTADAFSVLMNSSVKVNEDGSTIFNDLTGNPVSDTLDGFIKYVQTSGKYDAFLAAPQSQGAVLKGSSGSAGAKVNGTMGGDRDQRKAAILNKYPELRG